jgi:hypothetical protein
MNKEFNRMLKLAGLMTEGLYTSDEKAPMEAMSHDGESRMTRTGLKKKIKEMMLGEAAPINTVTTMDGNTVVGTHQYGVGFKSNEIGKNKGLQDHSTSIPNGTKMVKAEMGSLDEDHTMDAYQIARELVRRMPFPDAVFASKDLFLATIDALHDELYSYAEDQFGDAGSAPDEDDNYDDSRDVYDDQYPDMAESIDENVSDIPSSVSKSSVELLISAAKRIIGALKDSGFEQEDIYDYIMDKVKTLSVDEALFEAKKDEEESDTEDVIVAEPGEGEVPAEDVAVDVADTNTQVDVNMDGVPDVDTGSAESKKAFTSLVDTYNSAKELGDPKLTQMIANALTYYNKNIILKSGQPQA